MDPPDLGQKCDFCDVILKNDKSQKKHEQQKHKYYRPNSQKKRGAPRKLAKLLKFPKKQKKEVICDLCGFGFVTDAAAHKGRCLARDRW